MALEMAAMVHFEVRQISLICTFFLDPSHAPLLCLLHLCQPLLPVSVPDAERFLLSASADPTAGTAAGRPAGAEVPQRSLSHRRGRHPPPERPPKQKRPLPRPAARYIAPPLFWGFSFFTRSSFVPVPSNA
jgi:hypothetical protein